MIKATFAAIALIFSLTGAAYFYLPESPQTPTTTASQDLPKPGRGQRESAKMPLQIALFGLCATSFYLWILISNLEEMGRN